MRRSDEHSSMLGFTREIYVQEKNPNKIMVRSSASATVVLPVRYGTGVAYHCIQSSQSTRGTSVRGCSTMFTETSMRCGAVMKMRQMEKSAQFVLFRRNKVYASWKFDKTPIAAIR